MTFFPKNSAKLIYPNCINKVKMWHPCQNVAWMPQMIKLMQFGKKVIISKDIPNESFYSSNSKQWRSFQKILRGWFTRIASTKSKCGIHAKYCVLIGYIPVGVSKYCVLIGWISVARMPQNNFLKSKNNGGNWKPVPTSQIPVPASQILNWLG